MKWDKDDNGYVNDGDINKTYCKSNDKDGVNHSYGVNGGNDGNVDGAFNNEEFDNGPKIPLHLFRFPDGPLIHHNLVTIHLYVETWKNTILSPLIH